jgi:hypothetical protein
MAMPIATASSTVSAQTWLDSRFPKRSADGSYRPVAALRARNGNSRLHRGGSKCLRRHERVGSGRRREPPGGIVEAAVASRRTEKRSGGRGELVDAVDSSAAGEIGSGSRCRTKRCRSRIVRIVPGILWRTGIVGRGLDRRPSDALSPTARSAELATVRAPGTYTGARRRQPGQHWPTPTQPNSGTWSPRSGLASGRGRHPRPASV